MLLLMEDDGLFLIIIPFLQMLRKDGMEEQFWKFYHLNLKFIHHLIMLVINSN